MQLLVSHGARRDSTALDGLDPTQIALRKGHVGVAAYLDRQSTCLQQQCRAFIRARLGKAPDRKVAQLTYSIKIDVGM